MPRNATLTDNKAKWRAMVGRLRDLESTSVTIGIHGTEAARSGGDLSNVDIGTIHEFGAPAAGIPERSFIRATIDGAEDALRNRVNTDTAKVLTGAMTAEGAATRFGLFAQGLIQQRIANGIDPPLAAETVARKGSDKPLIDTGQLRQSITFRVDR